MLNVVFYDTVNHCEVRSSQLMFINAVEHYVTCNDADDKDRPALDELWNTPVVIGEVGYKSPECGPYRNWDRHLMMRDLIYLRLER